MPIGALSEEAQEANNKMYKEFRLRNSRKHDKSATNIDVMHMMLATSDPYMNTHRIQKKKKFPDLSEDVKAPSGDRLISEVVPIFVRDNVP